MFVLKFPLAETRLRNYVKYTTDFKILRIEFFRRLYGLEEILKGCSSGCGEARRKLDMRELS
jgi:hypothetical protein